MSCFFLWQVHNKEEKEQAAKEELRMKQMKIFECRERADEMRLMDKIKFNQSISPEAQAVRGKRISS